MPYVSSRTPDGLPGKCPLCGREVVVQPSDPMADAPCPFCGRLIWPIEFPPHFLLKTVFVTADELSPEQREHVLALVRAFDQADSLERVEIVMELEDLLEDELPPELLE